MFSFLKTSNKASKLELVTNLVRLIKSARRDIHLRSPTRSTLKSSFMMIMTKVKFLLLLSVAIVQTWRTLSSKTEPVVKLAASRKSITAEVPHCTKYSSEMDEELFSRMGRDGKPYVSMTLCNDCCFESNEQKKRMAERSDDYKVKKFIKQGYCPGPGNGGKCRIDWTEMAAKIWWTYIHMLHNWGRPWDVTMNDKEGDPSKFRHNFVKYKKELDKTTLRCSICNGFCRVIFRGDNKCAGGKRAGKRGGNGSTKP